MFVMVFALMLVAAACGDDDDTTSTTVTLANASAPADDGDTGTPASTDDGDTDASADDSPNIGEGENTGFCEFVRMLDEDDDSFEDLDPASVQADIEESQDLIRQALSLAPSAVRSEVQLLADAFNTFAEFLAGNGYDLFALATSDDPALLAFDTPEVEQAGETVNAFCGIEDDDDSTAFGGGPGVSIPGGGTIPGSGTFPPDLLSSDLPEGFPAELVPPSVTETTTLLSVPDGPFGVIFETSASFEDTVTFYVGVLGESDLVFDEGGRNATWIRTLGTSITTITVAESDGRIQVSVSGSG